MATTIQLKRGTGSAVPTGLADGELAINLDNGKLYFGSGSTSINSFKFENLTAENYIVSSSVTNITTQTLSGSTSFGDSTDDTHQFTGAITASGDISASGNLLGGGITVNGNSHFNSSVIDLGVDDSDRINLNAEIITSATFLSNITSSGNISSSGTVTANSFTGNGLSIDGSSNAHIEVGEYNVGFDVVALNTIFITGSGLIISGAMADTNHHNMLKIGNVELLDLNTAISPNEFLIHNVNSFKITSGSDGGDAGNSGRLFEHNGTDFTLFRNNVASIAVTNATTTLTNTNVQFLADVLIKAPIESLEANGYFLFADGDPSIGNSKTQAINVGNVFKSLTGNVTASAVSASGTITAASAVLTTADINGGTIDGITSLTAGGDLDIGAHDLRAATLTADGLTSGRVIFAGTAGVLSDDADLTFATDTLTVTKIANVNSTSHITASGNISASGTINVHNIQSNGHNVANFDGDSINFGYENSTAIQIGKSGNPTIFYGNITASGALGGGNISASGTIIANHVNVDSAVTFGGSKRIIYNTDDENLVIQDSSLKVNSHITASGNISASGNIIANEFHGDGSNLTGLSGGTVGWHGSGTRIKILPRDFIADDGGRPIMIDDTGVASEELFLESFSSNPLYATVSIPTGYTATAVMIFGSATDAVEVWEHQINSKTGVSKGTGNVDTEIDITDVASSTTNYLFIQVANASGNEIHGGYVVITES